MIELEPCPFCGEKPEMIHAVLEEYHSVNPEIICRECGYRIKAKNLAIAIADSPKENCKFLDRQTIRIWNTRPGEDAKDKEIDSLKRTLQQIVEIANRRGHLTVATWQKDAWYGLAKIANEALNNAPDTGKMEG